MSQLPPGTYFLNGVIINNEVMTGYYARSIKTERFGWDEEKNQAKCMSFEVKAGEKLILPSMTMEWLSGRQDICPYISALVDNEDTYFIGDSSKIAFTPPR